MTHLRSLFHRHESKPIGGIDFLVYKLPFELFGDAVDIGKWIDSLGGDAADAAFPLDELRDAMRPGSPHREQLLRILACCLQLSAQPGANAEPQPLTPADVACMPAMMVAEAFAVLLEVNADFFFQTLPKLAKTAARLRLIGSELLSSLSAPDTGSTTSGATASPSSAAISP